MVVPAAGELNADEPLARGSARVPRADHPAKQVMHSLVASLYRNADWFSLVCFGTGPGDLCLL